MSLAKPVIPILNVLHLSSAISRIQMRWRIFRNNFVITGGTDDDNGQKNVVDTMNNEHYVTSQFVFMLCALSIRIFGGKQSFVCSSFVPGIRGYSGYTGKMLRRFINFAKRFRRHSVFRLLRFIHSTNTIIL